MIIIDEDLAKLLLSLSKNPEWSLLITKLRNHRERFISDLVSDMPSPTDVNYLSRQQIFRGMCTILDVLVNLFENPMEALEHVKRMEELARTQLESGT
jgi:hypothetical protein